MGAAADGFAMPPEWVPHERTLMAWPCRRELWGRKLQSAYAEYAGVANALVEFEPVTMVCANHDDAAHARARLSSKAQIVVKPIDDSWLRDSGPVFVLDRDGNRAAVHFGFNAWGKKFEGFENDAAIGAVLGGERVYDETDFVLEGGSVAVDGAGLLATTEQCLLNPNRNPGMTRDEIESRLMAALGATTVVWLEDGLAEDRDTDGHIDLIAAFTAPSSMLLFVPPPGDPNHEPMLENKRRAEESGVAVTTFEPIARGDVTMSFMNFYVANGCVIVPTAGTDEDAAAVEQIARAFPGREVVGTPGVVTAFGGGGPHCITQQVPRALDA